MGPYCKFCNERCFKPTPEKLHKIMKETGVKSIPDIMATCEEGKKLDIEKTGFSIEYEHVEALN